MLHCPIATKKKDSQEKFHMAFFLLTTNIKYLKKKQTIFFGKFLGTKKKDKLRSVNIDWEKRFGRK
jgi:hypothetical protein